MIHPLRRLGAAGLAAVALLCLGGCGAAAPTSGAPGGGTAPGRASAAPIKVDIAWVAISGSQLPLWVTYAGGYFKREGLDVTLNYIAGGATTMQALVSGQDQFATFGDTEVVDANAAHIPVVAIASCVDRPLFDVIGARGVTSFAQLKGGKLGVTQIGSVGYYVAEKAMALHHLSATDVTLFQIAAQPDLLSALTSGSVQAAVLVPPFTFKAVDAGLKVLYDPTANGVWGAMSNLNTTASYIQHHANIVQKVIDAYVAGTRRTMDDPAYAVRVFERFSKQDAAVAKRTYTAFRPYYADPPLKNVKALQAMVAFVAQTDPKAKGLDPAAMMDMKFVQKAA